MSKKLGVLTIHGMGNPEASYAEGLIRRLTKRLGNAASEVEFESCYWAPVLQERQDATWRRLVESDEMDAKALRRWILSALGDPVSYLSGFFKAGRPVYKEIHETMRASLEKLASRLPGADTTPLMVLAHSLGSVMITNYFWDEHTGAGRGIGKTPFEKTHTLTSLITYGSSIPLFLPPHGEVRCIQFPSPNLPARLRGAAKWENVYDPDDVLGYPLNNLWDDRQGTEIQDLPINAGMWPLSESPFSHVSYDADDDFLVIVDKRVKAILAVP